VRSREDHARSESVEADDIDDAALGDGDLRIELKRNSYAAMTEMARRAPGSSAVTRGAKQ